MYVCRFGNKSAWPVHDIHIPEAKLTTILFFFCAYMSELRSGTQYALLRRHNHSNHKPLGLGVQGMGIAEKMWGVIWVEHPTVSLLLFIFYADSIEMFCAIAAHKITAGWRLARSGKSKKKKNEKKNRKPDSGPRALELCRTMTTAIKQFWVLPSTGQLHSIALCPVVQAAKSKSSLCDSRS